MTDIPQPTENAYKQMDIADNIEQIKKENNYKVVKIKPSNPSINSLETVGCICSDELEIILH